MMSRSRSSSSSNSRKRGRDQEVDQNDRAVFAPAAAAAAVEKKGSRREAGEVLRPVGIFEFPWHVVETDSSGIWNLRRVFFTSLVDGCSASIGVPGDRLFAVGRSLFGLLDEATPSDDETDGAVDWDIWSYVLRHPLRWPREAIRIS